ncbi:DUF3467 domain-containing protein [Algisphaera agarilytica]|uniref:Uncharacterized protein n=1 Tax=Algisphaera agarilytica TaxID=1385975 RepID=A0A7X0H826_9BACT|nr:DUF3467 domain-containing protein [Algisphaera agarilytica]MBB6430988.1 hypothetical protein [Algisphaera agarilytica]
MSDPHGQEFKPLDPNQAGADGQRQVRVQFNEANVDTLYANAFRTNLGNQEVFLDLGINRFLGQQPTEGGDGQPVGSFRFDVSHRVAMNLTTAKQLAQHLNQVIQQVEQNAAAQNQA